MPLSSVQGFVAFDSSLVSSCSSGIFDTDGLEILVPEGSVMTTGGEEEQNTKDMKADGMGRKGVLERSREG